MNSEAFLSLYLEEIGVQAPVSSFLAVETPDSAQPVAKPVVRFEASVPTSIVEPSPADIVVAEPSQAFEVIQIESEVPEEPKLTEASVTEVEVPQIASSQAIAPESIEETKTPIAVVAPVAKPQTVEMADDLVALQTQATACKSCELADSRNQLVFGSGSKDANLVFIGDAPGRDEDLEGLPLIGRSGELFDRMLVAIHLERDEVYIMNGVKCRPHHGRNPKPEEFAMCERWLVAQLDILQPKMICMLGSVVAQTLLKSESSLTELRAGEFHFRGIPVLVIDHPSYLLRSQKHKRRAWLDLNRLKDYYQKLSAI